MMMMNVMIDRLVLGILILALGSCCVVSFVPAPFRCASESKSVQSSIVYSAPAAKENVAQPRAGPAQVLLNFALASPLWKHVLVPQARKTMAKTAEANGIEWTNHLDWIKSLEGPWQEATVESFLTQQPDVVVPDYYREACFHSYDEGNLCWQAALEVEIWSRAVGARNFPAYGKNGEDAFRDSFENALMQAGAKIPNKNAIVVDLGCGTGMSTRRLAKRYPSAAEIVGIDLSPFYIEIGKRLLNEAPKSVEEGGPWVTSITNDDRIDYRIADAAHTGLDDNSVDVVNLQFVLHELPVEAAKDIVDESWRILKTGGQLWISEMDFEAPAYAEQRANALLFSLIRATEPFLDVYADGFDEVKGYIVDKFQHTKLTAATGRHFALVATKNNKLQEGGLEDLRFNDDGTYRLEDTHLNLWESKQEEQ